MNIPANYPDVSLRMFAATQQRAGQEDREEGGGEGEEQVGEGY